ncbi:MAG: glycosyltransferase family 8 protein [Thermoguttaceae bacterium]|nr:glycosyltransferase family 8 protein [Thermoguttaceae bacterium]
MNTIHIAFASDENYVPHLAATIASVLSNSENENDFHIYILDGGIRPESQQKIRELTKIHPSAIDFLKPDWDILKDCPEISHFSKNTYARLLLPEMLPDLDRILYLDCDTIVTTSLSPLWKTDFQGKSLAAVEDLMEFFPVRYLQNLSMRKRLALSSTGFNAGMILINLEKIRNERLFQKTILWIGQNQEKLVVADQDGLNVIFENDFVVMPFKWNIQVQPGWFELLNKKQRKEFQEYENLVKNPVGIIHYVSGIKPWHWYYWEPAGKLYWHYLAMTPWKDLKPQGNWKVKLLNLVRQNKVYMFLKSLWFNSPFC